MPLPPAIGTCTITGKFAIPPDGAVDNGRVVFIGPELFDTTDHVVLASGAYVGELDGTGSFSVAVPYNDNPGVTPTGWSYQVIKAVAGGQESFYTQVTSALGPTVKYDALVQAPIPSGPIIPNPWVPLAAFTAKGDLLVGSGVATVTHVPVGADTNVLVADHTQPGGLNWAPPSGVSFGSAGNSAVGDVAAAGTASTASHSDHVHGREGFGAASAATGYGLSAANGTATTVSHSDHTHGTPALTVTAPPTTQAIGTAAALGVATLPALSDHVHAMAAAAAPVASAVGDTQATGVATTFAASDHKHAREAFGSVVALSAFNTSSANGTATTVAHSDHVHGAPALPVASTSVSGIIQLDGLAGDIAALAGSAAAGAVGKAADAGHVHPNTGLVTGVTAADTSVVIGGTSAAPTVRTGTLDVVATQHPAAADWSNNSHKITSLLFGSGANDAAAFGQIPVVATLSDITTATTRAAGATGRWADGAHVHGRDFFDAADHGFAGWNFDPVICSSTGAAPGSAGQLQVARIHVPYAQTITNIGVYVVTAGTSLTSGQNFIGLFNSSLNLLSASADQTTAWGTTGLKPAALGAAQSVAAGDYLIVFFYNGTGTVPAFGRSSCGITGLNNANVSGSSSRFATGSSGNTTSMPSATGALTTTNNGYWVFWS